MKIVEEEDDRAPARHGPDHVGDRGEQEVPLRLWIGRLRRRQPGHEAGQLGNQPDELAPRSAMAAASSSLEAAVTR